MNNTPAPTVSSTPSTQHPPEGQQAGEGERERHSADNRPLGANQCDERRDAQPPFRTSSQDARGQPYTTRQKREGNGGQWMILLKHSTASRATLIISCVQGTSSQLFYNIGEENIQKFPGKKKASKNAQLK